MTGMKYVVLFGIAIVVVAGCTASPTRLEANYGKAYHTAITRQIVPPETHAAVPSASGFDGKAAQVTIDRYREQFAKPPSRPVFAIPVGGVQ